MDSLGPGMARANPHMHGMLAYGYYIADSGNEYVRYKTSWGGSGDASISGWNAGNWQAELPVRGVIGYHPLPKITNVQQTNNMLNVQWDGPASILGTIANGTIQSTTPLHWYVLEKANALNSGNFEDVTAPTTQRSATLTNCCGGDTVFLRVKLLPPPSASSGP